MKQKIMHIFSRTPIHVGAGNSVGAVDSPIQRERHTRIPIIPGSSLKGVLADMWNDENFKRTDKGRMLFGNTDAEDARAGGLLIGEGRVLAFPVRSAKGAFAWITCPLALARYKRDADKSFTVPEVNGEDALVSDEGMKLGDSIVLEEYKFNVTGQIDAWTELKDAVDDEVWQDIGKRFAVVSDELFSYFCEQCCEVVSRIRIDDATGTVAPGALFNQEQVPSETMFYAVVGEQKSDCLDKLSAKLADAGNIIQVGGDETIGLGFCSVNID